MSDTPLLSSWKQFSLKWRRLQQFGQTDDESTWNGATGCTQTVLQRLVIAKTGVYYSPDQISKIAGYPWPDKNPTKRGMYPTEFQRVVDHFDLPYELKTGASWNDVIDGLRVAPVPVGILYGWWPEDQGYRYGGTLADGKPNGFAIRNGKTQLKGAEGVYHAVLFIGRKRVNGIWRILANEPNHGSTSRPEKPDWDSVRSSLAHNAYDMYAHEGRKRFAWLPTRTFRPKGF